MNKSKKIIIGVVIVLLIIVMGVVVYNLIEKSHNSENFKSESENLGNTTVNIVNSDKNEENPEQKIKKLTDMAEKTYTKYLDILPFKNSTIGPMPGILVKLGFETEESIEKILTNQKITDKSTYLKSNTKYNDFENEMLKYFSKDFLKENYSQYTNIDGYVGFCNCAGGTIPYSLKTIIFDYEENEKYYFDVTLIDMEMYEHFINPEEGESITEEDCYINTKVIFIKENGNLVIAEITN